MSDAKRAIDKSVIALDARLLDLDERLVHFDYRLLDFDEPLVDFDCRLLDLDERLVDFDSHRLDINERLVDIDSHRVDSKERLVDIDKVPRRNRQAPLSITTPPFSISTPSLVDIVKPSTRSPQAPRLREFGDRPQGLTAPANFPYFS